MARQKVLRLCVSHNLADIDLETLIAILKL